MRPSGNAATRPRTDKNAFQGLPDESWAPIICHSFREEVRAKINLSSAHFFIKRLWKIVGSCRFQSIWWGDDGNCIIIAKKMFRKEVLGRSGPLKIFETRSMRGFISQLSLHGFSQMEEHSPISASIKELQKIAAARSALGKLLFYYCPFFKRDYPQLLRIFKQNTNERKKTPAASSRSSKLKDDHPKRKRPNAHPAGGTAEEDTIINISSTNSSPAKPRADTTAHMDSATPPPAKRHRSHSPAGTQEAAPAPCAASPCCLTPPAPDSPVMPPMGHPMLLPGQPNLAAMQVPGAGPPPFDIPWLATATEASPFALPMPEAPYSQAPDHWYCPACTCSCWQWYWT